MMMRKNQSGIAHLAAILVIVLVAGLGFAGYRVYTLQNENKELKNTSQPEVNSENKPEAKSDIPEDFVEYKNTDLGFAFAYPKEWGDITVKDTRFSKKDPGKQWQLTFANHKDSEIAMGLTSVDWTSEHGRGGSCHATGGPRKQFRPKALNQATIVTELLLDQPNLVVVAHAEKEYCGNFGLMIEYYYEKNKTYEGVLLTYITNPNLPQTEFENYRKNIRSYIPDGLDDQIVQVAKTFKEL